MRKASAAGLLVWLIASPLYGFEITPGIYDVSGTENDGSTPYRDVVRLSVDPDGTCKFDYGSPPEVIEGLCIISGEAMAASSVMGGHWYGLFRAAAEGVLQGTWRIEGEPGVGIETLTLRK